MPKKFRNRLTVKQIEALRDKGYYADGGNLYIKVTTSGSKSWVLFYTIGGKNREMGLGGYSDVSLADARDIAEEQRKLIKRDGVDPVAKRQADRVASRIEDAKRITFEQAAYQYIEAHRTGWKNAKHAEQWSNTLRDYAYPTFGKLPVAAVDTSLVMKAIEPIWQTKTETATRVRGRIEAILDWATTRGYRDGVNPARWRGHLENLLPARNKVQKVKHHAALPIAELGKFMSDVRKQQGTAARTLEFCILTACRTGEVIGAKWDEIDFTNDTWTIPAERMKAGKEHRVPLSPRAREILKNQESAREGDYVFAGARKGRPLSNAAMLELLKRMNRGDLTVHGFRSTFRDWASEHTNYPREVCEMALAHTIADKVEAAYRRGDLFTQRKKLMQQWAEFCQRVYLNSGFDNVTIMMVKG
jgi:integrase